LRAAATQVVERARLARPDARLSGVLACEMVPDGMEVIVGAINDTGFGPVIALGLGGVFTEMLDDVTYGIAPFGRAEALRMINGLRGRTARDVDALVDALVRASGLAWQLRDRLVEMDINPLLVRARGHGVVAADAVISLRDGASRETRQ
jgi:acyl-CoA synthetase (NDP forming)